MIGKDDTGCPCVLANDVRMVGRVGAYPKILSPPARATALEKFS
jgi:hypothetical protein